MPVTARHPHGDARRPGNRGDARPSALSAAQGLLAWDVRFAYLPAAESVLHGHSPYPALDDPILDEQKGYVYPPQLLFVLLPLTALPVAAGCRLWSRRG